MSFLSGCFAYLQSFEQFIQENINKVSALKVICTSPKELDRKSLREMNYPGASPEVSLPAKPDQTRLTGRDIFVNTFFLDSQHISELDLNYHIDQLC